MTTATAAKEKQATGLDRTEVVAEQELGADGYPFRLWPVGGDRGPLEKFSLRPYEEDERPIYWNPITRDGHMWWRDYRPMPDGIHRVVAKHRWVMPYPGSFRPRNAWEEHMVREWLVEINRGEMTVNPDDWKGTDHPENEPGQPPHLWVCECSWGCGKWAAMKAHQIKHTHKHVTSV